MESNPIIKPVRLLILIIAPKLAEKAKQFFEETATALTLVSSAVGTAPGELIELLGLGNTDKLLFAAVLPKDRADTMLKGLEQVLKLRRINSGIAFTLPINGANTQTVRAIQFPMNDTFHPIEVKDQKEGDFMPGTNYSVISVLIDHGFSENVVNAAREAGAGGGTVIHSRQLLTQNSTAAWGIRLQEERELVMLLVEAERRSEIMKAISAKCGLNSEAHGIILSLPVDGVVGLSENDF